MHLKEGEGPVSKPEYQRRASIWGLVVLLVLVDVGCGGLLWMAGSGVFPLYASIIPTAVSIPAIAIYWRGERSKWPSKNI